LEVQADVAKKLATQTSGRQQSAPSVENFATHVHKTEWPRIDTEKNICNDFKSSDSIKGCFKLQEIAKYGYNWKIITTGGKPLKSVMAVNLPANSGQNLDRKRWRRPRRAYFDSSNFQM
jgi:hypothetical protein